MKPRPACGHPESWGPASIIHLGQNWQYVSCKRCGENHLYCVSGEVPDTP